MNVGIFTDQEEDAKILASWLLLGQGDWYHIQLPSIGRVPEKGLILAVGLGRYGDTEAYFRDRNRLIVLPTLNIGMRTTVYSILALARSQGTELTLEELHHFTAAGFIVLDSRDTGL